MAELGDWGQGRLTAAEARGALVWLLDLEVAGQVARLSTQEREVTIGIGVDAETWHYYGGLDWDGELADPHALFSDEVETRSISLDMHLYPQIDVAALVADGHCIGAAVATLRLWPLGGTRAIRALRGRISQVSYDETEGTVHCSLEESPADDRTLWPDATARCGGLTWTNLSSKARGEMYPWVFGCPGRNSSGYDPPWGGSPGLYVDDVSDILLIAGHRVLADAAEILNFDTQETKRHVIEHMQDGLGRTIAFVTLLASAGFTVDPENEYWASWEESSAPASAIIDQFAHLADDPGDAQGLRGAGDILIWWLRQSGIEWDAGRMHAVRDRLNAFKIDTYAEAEADNLLSPYEYLIDQILPVLPVAPRIGPRGLHYLIWPYDLDSTSVVADLEEGRTCSPNGGYELSDFEDIANTLVIHYGRDEANDEHRRTLVITGSRTTFDSWQAEAAVDSDVTVIYSLWAKRSLDIYGEEITDEVSLGVVQDPGTAGRVGHWMVRKRAAQWMTCSYQVDASVAASLHPGDVVTITHASRGLASRLAYVSDLTWTDGGLWDVELRLPAAEMGHPA